MDGSRAPSFSWPHCSFPASLLAQMNCNWVSYTGDHRVCIDRRRRCRRPCCCGAAGLQLLLPRPERQPQQHPPPRGPTIRGSMGRGFGCSPSPTAACDYDAGSSSSFWSYEWSKHGTCALPLFGSQQAYFNATMALSSAYDVAVRSSGAVLSASAGGSIPVAVASWPGCRATHKPARGNQWKFVSQCCCHLTAPLTFA